MKPKRIKITVMRDPQYAPVGFLVCKVFRLNKEGRRWDTRDDDNTVLIQSDWDFPSLAIHFGWQPCHGETDGTVDCPVCGKSATDLITDAYDYLENHQGKIIDDPCEYF